MRAFIITLAAVAAGAAAMADTQRSHDAAVARNLNTFNTIVKELELNYVDSISTDAGFEAAIAAMLSTVDPYTEYYTADDQDVLMRITTGEWGGIGSFIMERDGSTYISAPMEGSPSAEAGMLPGDRILKVDTTDTHGLKSDEVSKLLRGQAGTIVEVTVERPFDPDSIKTFRLERRKMQEPSVAYYGVVGGNTGYIKLNSFIDKSPREVREALESFKANPAVENIVLDLRGNGGGLLESAVDIVGYFVPKGTEVLRTRGRDKSLEKIYKTTRTPIYPDIPLAVLIDGGSASSSEITAGALQDLDRAVLVGSRSFGKGLVQATRPLPYDGILKVTVGKYYIPSGRLIQALDYSHRNPDGSVARTPDSLTNVYKTLHGREVRDGGGLTPDSTVEWEKASVLLYDLMRGNRIFDYATRFKADHREIAPAEEFTVTDEIYADFKNSVTGSDFKSEQVFDDMIKQLRTAVKDEGYLDTATEAQLDTLSKLLRHDLGTDLDLKRGEITQYLGREIAGRYYYDRGRIIQDLRDDKGLEAARAILNNPGEYKAILSGNRKKEQ